MKAERKTGAKNKWPSGDPGLGVNYVKRKQGVSPAPPDLDSLSTESMEFTSYKFALRESRCQENSNSTREPFEPASRQ